MIGRSLTSQRRWVFDLIRSTEVFVFTYDGEPWVTDRYLMVRLPDLAAVELADEAAVGTALRWPSSGKPVVLGPGESSYHVAPERCAEIIDQSLRGYGSEAARTGELWRRVDDDHREADCTALLRADGQRVIMWGPAVTSMPEAWTFHHPDTRPGLTDVRLAPVAIRDAEGALQAVVMPHGYDKVDRVKVCDCCGGDGLVVDPL